VSTKIARRPNGPAGSSPPRVALGIALGIALALASGRPARAHTVGLSLADFDVQPDGSVEALLTFATAEPLGGISLDRDRDGRVGPGDLAAAQDDLRAFLQQGVEVDADGTACPQEFREATVSETDALLLRGTFACPRGAEEIGATLYYLSALRRGHREVARITAGSETVTEVLTGERRAIALRLPAAARAAGAAGGGAAVRHGWWPPVLGVIAASFIGLFAWGARTRRWRGARATWQNRGS
jgi:hypothetical protein